MKVVASVIYVLAALFLVGALVYGTSWSRERDLIKWKGELVNRHDVRDEYGAIPPNTHDAAKMRRLKRRALDEAHRLADTKRKISRTALPPKVKDKK